MACTLKQMQCRSPRTRAQTRTVAAIAWTLAACMVLGYGQNQFVATSEHPGTSRARVITRAGAGTMEDSSNMAALPKGVNPKYVSANYATGMYGRQKPFQVIQGVQGQSSPVAALLLGGTIVAASASMLMNSASPLKGVMQQQTSMLAMSADEDEDTIVTTKRVVQSEPEPATTKRVVDTAATVPAARPVVQVAAARPVAPVAAKSARPVVYAAFARPAQTAAARPVGHVQPAKKINMKVDSADDKAEKKKLVMLAIAKAEKAGLTPDEIAALKSAVS